MSKSGPWQEEGHFCQIHRKGSTELEPSTTTLGAFHTSESAGKEGSYCIDHYNQPWLLCEAGATVIEYSQGGRCAGSGRMPNWQLCWLCMPPSLLHSPCPSLQLPGSWESSSTEAFASGSTFRRTQIQAAVPLVGSNVLTCWDKMYISFCLIIMMI